MKKADLKQLIKPLVKECIHEVLLEEGLLSNVVAEVTRGLQGSLITEHAPATASSSSAEEEIVREKAVQSRQQLKAHRRKLMEAIGNESYGGVDLFEGTTPMAQQEPKAGTTDLGDPGDSGVDISSIFGNSSRIWEAMK